MSETRVVLDERTRFKKPRIWELDFLRGVSIILMCVDHFFYDVYYIFGDWKYSSSSFFSKLYQAAAFFFGYHPDSVVIPEYAMQYSEFVFLWFILAAVALSFVVRELIINKRKTTLEVAKNYVGAFVSIGLCVAVMSLIHRFVGYEIVEGNSLREFIHIIILWIFFILCGEGCAFSRSNVKRTALIALCAAAISAATIFGEKVLDIEGIAVRYGVLHMLATAVFIYTVIQLFWTWILKNKEKRKYAISITCFLLGAVTYFLNQYLWTIEVSKIDALAWFHYAFAENFHSADWFVLSEHLHRVLFGAAIAPFVYPDKSVSYIPKLQPLNKGVICFLGRKTIWIVLIHQIAIYVLLTLLNSFAF